MGDVARLHVTREKDIIKSWWFCCVAHVGQLDNHLIQKDTISVAGSPFSSGFYYFWVTFSSGQWLSGFRSMGWACFICLQNSDPTLILGPQPLMGLLSSSMASTECGNLPHCRNNKSYRLYIYRIKNFPISSTRLAFCLNRRRLALNFSYSFNISWHERQSEKGPYVKFEGF